MKRAFILNTLVFLCACSTMHADEILSLFIRPYPAQQLEQEASFFAQKLTHPTKTAQSILKHTLQAYPLAGVMATYAGYLAFSDTNGQMSFPRKHEASRIHLVITPAITPVLMMSNTIHHWELEIGTPAAMYNIERKLDPETNLAYWDTQEEPLPENNEIPLEALIIFDRPKDIYVPIGITVVKQTPNLVLPDIYLKQVQSTEEQAFYLLNIRMFFGTVNHLYKKQPKAYEELIAP